MRLNRDNLNFRDIDIKFENNICLWHQGNTKIAASVKPNYYKGITFYYMTADTNNNFIYKPKYRRELEITSLGNNIFKWLF